MRRRRDGLGRGVAVSIGAFGSAAIGALAWGACSSQRELELAFWSDYLNGRGLVCVDGDKNPLLERARNVPSFSVVADLIAVPNVTTGQLDQIQDTCATSGCPFVGQRQCWTLPTPHITDGSAAKVASYVADFLHDAGDVVTANAPDAQILVRVVFTTEPCDGGVVDPAAGFERCDLLGCALSAPFNPSVASGTITLDLDVPEGFTACEPIVCACAEQSATGSVAASCSTALTPTSCP